MPATRTRLRLRISGVVQGVGFRPFVHRLAGELGLAGHVGNDAAGVFVEVEGPAAAVDAFTVRVSQDVPPLARVHDVQVTAMPPLADAAGTATFRIVASPAGGAIATLVPPDVGDLRRLPHGAVRSGTTAATGTRSSPAPTADPATRSPVAALRPAGHDDGRLPDVRRLRGASTTTRPTGASTPSRSPVPTVVRRCGTERSVAASGSTEHRSPAWWRGAGRGRSWARSRPWPRPSARLAAGGTVAVKGVGGFHLACDATSPAAVDRCCVRRKQRPDKPFAVMVADLEAARADRGAQRAVEAAALTSPQRPVVLRRRTLPVPTKSGRWSRTRCAARQPAARGDAAVLTPARAAPGLRPDGRGVCRACWS
jgi:hydrogenase maturation protein HypF